MPRFPSTFLYMGEAHVRGKLCDHWREDHGEETVEYFEGWRSNSSCASLPPNDWWLSPFVCHAAAVDTKQPLRLTTEAVEATSPVRITTPLMTYDFYRFESGPPPEEAFRMKASTESPIFATSTQLAVDECERVVQDMGFPYIHFMHTYYYV